jgi:UDP-N-acetylglucosamine acyltransferase
MAIHPTAIVDPRAEIDPTAEVGPFVVVEGPVVVGPGTRILAHGFLTGDTRIGRDNVIHVGAVIGHEPQHLGYTGAPTALRIGDRNVFREHSEVHRGWQEGSATTIGDDNYVMSQGHIGHDCRLGDRNILASGALLGGHVELVEQVFVGGGAVVHQHVRVGRLALLRGLTRVSRDVPPFCVASFTNAVSALNAIGLRRAGLPAARIRALRRAFARLFHGRHNLRHGRDRAGAGDARSRGAAGVQSGIDPRRVWRARRRRGGRGVGPIGLEGAW